MTQRDGTGRKVGGGFRMELYVTLSDAMDCGLPRCSVHGVFQARVLEWGAIAFSVFLY